MRKILICGLSILFYINLQAQNLTVGARIDSTVIVIGGQTTLIFEINQVPGKKVITPLFSDTIIGALEIVESPKADTTKADNGNILIKQRYVVTSFEDSLLYIPPYPFVLNGDTVWSKSLSLKVVQPFQIDTTKNEIADIKPVMDPPFNWKAVWRIIAIVLLIVIIGILIYILVRKLIQKKPIFESATPEPVLPPHVVALAQLDRIRNEKAWQQNRTKQFHTDITDVLRIYIEKVYNVPCMEMTSDEIISNLHHLKFENKTVYTALMQILQLADLVKFAKWDAAPDEHEKSLTNAFLFVNETMIDEEPPEELPQTPKGA